MNTLAKAAPLLISLLVVLGGCSTVAARRDDPPTLVRQTSKSITEFRSCFLPQFDRSTYPVAYSPTASGETYSWGASQGIAGRYVSWVVDIIDQGSAREVRLYALSSIRGPDKSVAAKVEGCL